MTVSYQGADERYPLSSPMDWSLLTIPSAHLSHKMSSSSPPSSAPPTTQRFARQRHPYAGTNTLALRAGGLAARRSMLLRKAAVAPLVLLEDPLVPRNDTVELFEEDMSLARSNVGKWVARSPQSATFASASTRRPSLQRRASQIMNLPHFQSSASSLDQSSPTEIVSSSVASTPSTRRRPSIAMSEDSSLGLILNLKSKPSKAAERDRAATAVLAPQTPSRTTSLPRPSLQSLAEQPANRSEDGNMHPSPTKSYEDVATPAKATTTPKTSSKPRTLRNVKSAGALVLGRKTTKQQHQPRVSSGHDQKSLGRIGSFSLPYKSASLAPRSKVRPPMLVLTPPAPRAPTMSTVGRAEPSSAGTGTRTSPSIAGKAVSPVSSVTSSPRKSPLRCASPPPQPPPPTIALPLLPSPSLKDVVPPLRPRTAPLSPVLPPIAAGGPLKLLDFIRPRSEHREEGQTSHESHAKASSNEIEPRSAHPYSGAESCSPPVTPTTPTRTGSYGLESASGTWPPRGLRMRSVLPTLPAGFVPPSSHFSMTPPSPSTPVQSASLATETALASSSIAAPPPLLSPPLALSTPPIVSPTPSIASSHPSTAGYFGAPQLALADLENLAQDWPSYTGDFFLTADEEQQGGPGGTGRKGVSSFMSLGSTMSQTQSRDTAAWPTTDDVPFCRQTASVEEEQDTSLPPTSAARSCRTPTAASFTSPGHAPPARAPAPLALPNSSDLAAAAAAAAASQRPPRSPSRVKAKPFKLVPKSLSPKAWTSASSLPSAISASKSPSSVDTGKQTKPKANVRSAAPREGEGKSKPRSLATAPNMELALLTWIG
ncbi:hypothetical protein BDZ90DRAFT_260010 [Jaminaea rosea]|uniref:Uncharacterized protein n=1 Tax=Jaminaea rosea TaxID=1569628 RepID=A0A316UV34_9BASI|nr:hypothetical protein BDZ90DRAFT_260010 [Jaminaea rosea]PWN28191.1 hypothetical protein BDZ90DRAFT_260010 [Jaminaea rosea]